jgi:hypothetical protein
MTARLPGETPAVLLERWLARVEQGAAEITARRRAPRRPDAVKQLLLWVRFVREAVARGAVEMAAVYALELGVLAESLDVAPHLEIGQDVVAGGREGARRWRAAHPMPDYQAALEAEFRRSPERFKLTATQGRLARRFGVCLKTIQRHTTDPRTGS